jgi:hypothetical protein
MSSPASRTEAQTPERVAAEERVVAQLDAWRASAIPDPSAPLDAEELARLVRSCFDALGIDPAVGADFSVNTVHYYRRKDILDAPSGRTSAARYDVRHVWQAAGARLAGYLGLVTLAEARRVTRGADERALVRFVAARVVDAHARTLMRRAAAVFPRMVAEPNAYPVVSAVLGGAETRARPLPGVHAASASAVTRAELPTGGSAPASRGLIVDAPFVRRDAIWARVIPLADDAMCILPETHPAHESVGAARRLVRELATALGVPLSDRTLGDRDDNPV